VLGRDLPYDNLASCAGALAEINPVFAANIDEVSRRPGASSAWRGAMDGAPFVSPIEDFYMTDPISRASRRGRMHRLEAFVAGGKEGATGTHG
jgi:NADH-quinone oxidoreductase subunit G